MSCRCLCASLQVSLELLHVGPVLTAKEAHHPLPGPVSTTTPAAAALPADNAAARSGPTLVQGIQGSSGAAKVKQQLAHLKGTILAAVQQLVGRIGTAAELCEALSCVLAAAGAELGLAASAVDSAGPAGLADLAARLSGDFSEKASASAAADREAAATGGGAAAGDQAAARQAAELTEAAAATMMLQCGATATDAFVQRCRRTQPEQPAAVLAAGQLIRDKLLVLPGGVLPGNLVAAALPLLAAGQAVVRRPVQRILLGLLPAAHKVGPVR